MSANRIAGFVVIVSGVWLSGLTPTMGQSPDCPAWEQRHPAHAPSPRYGHAMAYDSAREATVLFGGIRGQGAEATWEWDGADWMERSASGPAARVLTAMAYDELRGVMVLFGGNGANGALGDTWEWDGVLWTLRSTSGPSRRESHAMVYDSARGVTVLFGGVAAGKGFYGDTWEWDGTTWALRSTTGPAPRWDHDMAYDSRRHLTVLYGGSSGYSQTWEWDGKVWVFRTASVSPGFRLAHSMAYDYTRGVTLLFSGLGPGGPTSETWAWDGSTWTLFNELGPPGRLYAGMAYDSTRGVTVLFGGVDGGDGYPTNDTWELQSCPVDSDGEGVNDPDDECDFSDLKVTIVIGNCDSGVLNQLFDDGCTMGDRIGKCADGARNHGAFVSCVVQLTNDWAQDDIITSRDKGAVQRCAAQAKLPNRRGNNSRAPKGASTLSIEALSRP